MNENNVKDRFNRLKDKIIEKTFSNMNENQKKAVVKELDRPVLVIAGPGTGKTTTIVNKINFLIRYSDAYKRELSMPSGFDPSKFEELEGILEKGSVKDAQDAARIFESSSVNPNQILAISFTKNASTEIRERTIRLCPRARSVNFGTFHSVFFKILRYFKGYKIDQILDEGAKLKVFKNILKTLNIENHEDEEVVREIQREIAFFRNELMGEDFFKSDLISDSELVRVNSMYQNYKQEMDKIDFDDMLVDAYHLLKNEDQVRRFIQDRYKYILVDEFQDINKVQLEVLKLMAKPGNKVFAVGDEDQSIYGFRGARPDFLMDFDKHFSDSSKIILDINYRSTDQIIDSSKFLISKNENRYKKDIRGLGRSGDTIQCIRVEDAEDEARKIGTLILSQIEQEETSHSDYAIIYRTNMQSRALIDVFMDLNIPFDVKDSVVSIYDHWISKDIITYLKIAALRGGFSEYKRIINKPFRFISRDKIENLNQTKDFLFGLKNSNLHPAQVRNIQNLEENIKILRMLDPQKAVNFIRQIIEYDRHIIEYCDRKRINNRGCFEILDELESSSKNFKTIEEFLDHIETYKERVIEAKKSDDKEKVIFTTIHSAKGLEFKRVFIIGCIESVIPHEKAMEEDLLEEERRLFYVAMTRSKEKLYFGVPLKRYGKIHSKSRFVDECMIKAQVDLNSKLDDSIAPGDRVYHREFQAGTVLGIEDNMIRIEFASAVKTFDLNFCLKNNIMDKI